MKRARIERGIRPLRGLHQQPGQWPVIQVAGIRREDMQRIDVADLPDIQRVFRVKRHVEDRRVDNHGQDQRAQRNEPTSARHRWRSSGQSHH